MSKSKFSSVLNVSDLNDFITPSQTCIKPVEVIPTSSVDSSKINYEDKSIDSIEIHEIGKKKETATEKLKPATITLSDCLACSGCITTAESVLVNQQTSDEVYRVLKSNKETSTQKYVIASISPQTRASFAAKYHLSLVQAARKISFFLKSLGVHKVFDTSFSRDLSLLSMAQEFVHLHQQSSRPLPLITSACPGWICYAEKSHSYILPYISKTKSPQQMMGSLVKYYYSKRHHLRPEEIYHMTIMPCYDKKLEASRDDFYNDIYKTREVDCVLTTGELEKMILEHDYAPEHLDEMALDPEFSNLTEEHAPIGTEGSGSGGYLEFVLKYAAKSIYAKEIELKNVQINAVRNKDFKEYILQDDHEKPLLKFAAVYGFRNIQNILRRFKTNDRPYDFIEIMACPSGCLNGGGQLMSNSLDTSSPNPSQKDLLRLTESLYSSTPTRSPRDNSHLDTVIKEWIGDDHWFENLYMKSEGDKFNPVFTNYHAVPPTTFRIDVKW